MGCVLVRIGASAYAAGCAVGCVLVRIGASAYAGGGRHRRPIIVAFVIIVAPSSPITIIVVVVSRCAARCHRHYRCLTPPSSLPSSSYPVAHRAVAIIVNFVARRAIAIDVIVVVVRRHRPCHCYRIPSHVAPLHSSSLSSWSRHRRRLCHRRHAIVTRCHHRRHRILSRRPLPSSLSLSYAAIVVAIIVISRHPSRLCHHRQLCCPSRRCH